MDTKSCQRPFISEDFATFDKIADGRLYLSELDGGQLDCIIEHLIRTKDAGVREDLRSRVQNDLREAIRERLLELENSPHLPDDLSDRISHLLSTDYSDDNLVYSAAVQYKYGAIDVDSAYGDTGESYDLRQHGLTGYGSLDGKFDIGRWQLAPQVLALYEHFWTEESTRYSDGGAVEASRNSYWGFNGAVSGSALRRDESIKLSAYFDGTRFQDPPPGSTLTQLSSGGGLHLKEIGGSPFSLNAYVDWYMKDSTPISENLLDPRHDSLLVQGEASYMFESAGILVDYSHSDEDSISPMNSEDTTADSGSLLAHVALGKGYLRIGAGGGYWTEDSELIDGEANTSSGGEAHAGIRGSWSPIDALSIRMSLWGYANQSDGTFVGWFPSGVASTTLELSLGDVTVGVSGSVEAQRRDLNLYQTRLDYTGEAQIAYAPTDYFNVSASGSYSATDVEGHDEYEQKDIDGSGSVNFRLISDPDLWLTFEGMVKGSEYLAADYSMDSLDAGVVTYLMFRY